MMVAKVYRGEQVRQRGWSMGICPAECHAECGGGSGHVGVLWNMGYTVSSAKLELSGNKMPGPVDGTTLFPDTAR